MEKEKYAKETLLAQIAGGAKLYAAASYATFPEKEKCAKETLLAWFGGGADLLTLPAPLCSPADAIHARGKSNVYTHFSCLFLRKRIFRQARQITSEYCRIREEFNKAWRESRPQKPCGDRACRARGSCQPSG